MTDKRWQVDKSLALAGILVSAGAVCVLPLLAFIGVTYSTPHCTAMFDFRRGGALGIVFLFWLFPFVLVSTCFILGGTSVFRTRKRLARHHLAEEQLFFEDTCNWFLKCLAFILIPASLLLIIVHFISVPGAGLYVLLGQLLVVYEQNCPGPEKIPAVWWFVYGNLFPLLILGVIALSIGLTSKRSV